MVTWLHYSEPHAFHRRMVLPLLQLFELSTDPFGLLVLICKFVSKLTVDLTFGWGCYQMT
jgi:hypothetical protein